MTYTRINLNLLICLHYILKEQSVSLAAKRMYVSQSAMSKSLSQLREHLNDPIIVRNKGRTEITAAAKTMQRQVEHIVSSAIHFFENTRFNPERSRNKFSILCGEVAMQLFFPALIQKISSYAPHISIELVHASPSALTQITKGEIDLALMFSQHTPSHLNSTTLMSDELVVVMNKEHPLSDQPLTKDNFTDYPFLALTPEHKEYVKTTEQLNKLFNRKIAAELPSVSMIFNMLEHQPYLAVLPKAAIHLAHSKKSIVQKELPIDGSSCVPLNLLWCPNHDSSSANIWLRTWLTEHFLECL